ncbi:MAG TPA: hypothetical protein VES65_03300 [Solirubrobacteraceae bacterium]|nr:hypothetical protein [Solirubrobacteraceae bacterium]
MLVEIVADGGPRLGFGHVGRCLALWEELDGRAAFRVQDETVAGFLRARGAQAAPAGYEPIVLLDRAQQTDEAQVRALQAAGRRVVLLDDLGSGRMAADAVIDPPTAAEWPPAVGLRLAGFEHVLLRREIREAVPRESTRPYVLVALGGSDPAGLTPAVADALSSAGLACLVVLGPGYRGPRPSPGTAVIGPAEWPAALAGATMLVTGFGHTLLEAAHLGSPAVSVVSRAEQAEDAAAFAKQETMTVVSMTSGPRPRAVADAVAALMEDEAGRASMSRRGREFVDGRGAERVATALIALA